MIGFFLLINAMSLSKINFRPYDGRVTHLSMCGWDQSRSGTSQGQKPHSYEKTDNIKNFQHRKYYQQSKDRANVISDYDNPATEYLRPPLPPLQFVNSAAYNHAKFKAERASETTANMHGNPVSDGSSSVDGDRDGIIQPTAKTTPNPKGVHEEPEEDHVDRGLVKIEWDKFYILTYMSPETASNTDKDGSHNGNKSTGTSEDRIHGGGDVATNQGDSPTTVKSPSTMTTSRKVTEPNTVFYNTAKPTTISGKTTPAGLFRKRRSNQQRGGRVRREAIVIPKGKAKDKTLSAQTSLCSCTISTKANNLNISILHVSGPKPEESRMVITSYSKSEPIANLDVAGFWDPGYTAAEKWQKSGNTVRITITIRDRVKPRSPYMIMMGVSGGNDLHIDCRSKSNLLGDIRGPEKIDQSTRLPSNPSTETEHIIPKKTQETPREEAVKDGGVVDIENPIFIGGITALFIALICFIIALTFWKRSRAFLSKARRRSSSSAMGAQRYTKHDEMFYEEIPDNNRGRSGSKTKLGTLSLSIRGQNSPVLNHHDRKKDSLDRKSILTTVTHAHYPGQPPVKSLVHEDSDDGGKHDLYEELPEYSKTTGATSNGSSGFGVGPPPKPFLDRESLMIQRSQSTPIRYSTSGSSNGGNSDVSSESEDESRRRKDNRRVKTSLSYSEDSNVRIKPDFGALLLNREDFMRMQKKDTTTGKCDFDALENSKQQTHGQQTADDGRSSDASNSHCDNNDENGNDDYGADIEGDNGCDCGDFVDPDKTYAEIDFQSKHAARASQNQNTNSSTDNNNMTDQICNGANINSGESAFNAQTDQSPPDMMPRKVFSEAHGEEMTVYPNVLYHSNAEVLAS